ncbi:ribosome maturation factor RimM [Zongyangia hominis]|uniref:Ribosome maturation factor RimM n=1 Tax=Zongyangia hominis TaxID=2763677 RepID=A0A926IBF4_9FIRM|nr:ribosome maturation factor RimM [Zongyangia hominis]MBC8570122.1 16S rRNA processing protein RimM [Zongyangia hominis]
MAGKKYLETGKIVTTHGIKGEVKVYPWCDAPEFLLDFDRLYLDKGKRAVEVEECRIHKNMAILKLKGVDTVEQAVSYRGKVLYVDRDEIELAEGEYFVQDLIGLTVRDADSGKEYGKITDVTETGANDVYHVAFPDGSVKLIPAIKDVVIRTNIDEGVMEIRPLRGLFDDED